MFPDEVRLEEELVEWEKREFEEMEVENEVELVSAIMEVKESSGEPGSIVGSGRQAGAGFFEEEGVVTA